MIGLLAMLLAQPAPPPTSIRWTTDGGTLAAIWLPSNTLLATGVGGSGAPTDAEYWTGAAHAGLSAEKNLGALSTALVINTAGVPSAYAGASCTNQFPRSLSAVGAATCASVALATDTSGTLAQTRGGTGSGSLTCAAGQALTSDGTVQSCTSTITASTNANLTGPVTSIGNATTIGAGQVSDGNLANNYSGVGTCTNQFARVLNDNAAPTCASIAIADHSATGTPSATTFYRGDNTWSTPAGSSSPLTTKGDLYTFTTVDARKAVGANGLCLKANSAEATGLEWAACSAGGGISYAEAAAAVMGGF